MASTITPTPTPSYCPSTNIAYTPHPGSLFQAPLPVEVSNFLTANAHLVQHFVAQNKGLIKSPPQHIVFGYYLYHGVINYHNMIKLRDAAHKFKLDSIGVKNRYLYHIPGQPEDVTDDNYLVIVDNGVEKFGSLSVTKSLPSYKLNLYQVRQLYKLALIVNYNGLGEANYVLATNNMIVITNTSAEVMPECKIKEVKLEWLTKDGKTYPIRNKPKIIDIGYNPLDALEKMFYSRDEYFDKYATNYLILKIAKYKKALINN